MKDFLLAVAVFATIAISSAIDEECIQRKIRGLPVHWPNPTNCSSFYRCTNKNIRREFLCPEGREYNPETGRCGSKGKSLCRLSLMAPLPGRANNPCLGIISGTLVPDPKSCRGFNICNDNKTYPQTCDSGSYFNDQVLACEPDTKNLCWENLCVNKANGTYVPNQKDCLSFYICYEEKPVAQKCPKSSYFNIKTLSCQMGECPAEENTTTTIATTTSGSTTSTQKTTSTTTCTPDTTSTTCTAKTTTSSCTPPTTATTTCTPDTTSTTCTAKTTTSSCTPQTTATTTCTPETTTTTCSTKTTTSTCAPQTTTTCTPNTTTTTCTAKTTTTTTTCAPQTTTTTCAAVTTTTCIATETTTCSSANLNCDTSKCRNAQDGFIYPAQNTYAGFCVCLNRKPEYHQCPNDAVFIESLQMCVAQDKVCPSSKCSKLPDYSTFAANNTTHGFCRCLDGKATFFGCIGDDYAYNSTLSICMKSNKTNDYLEEPKVDSKLCKGGFSEGDFISHPVNCMLFYICYEGELVECSCETGNYYDGNIKVCLPDNERKCPDSHQPQVYSNNRRHKRSVARENCVEGSKTPAADCDKYYKCSGGHKLLYGCGKDNFFNLTTLACQLDVEHVCWPANSCTTGAKTPYPDDNTKYYECAEGELKLLSCGSNQYFNKLSMTCVAKEECTCPGGYKEGDISAHPTDCDKFYICLDGEQMLHECGQGNYFDKETLSCEKDVKNTCNVEKPCLCPGGYNEGDLSAHPTDCDKYYICEDGKQVLQQCGKNNYFDNSTLACEPDIYNECWAKAACTCPDGYEEGDFSPHPTECSKYYICHDGQQILEDCGINNYFSNNTLTCQPDIYHVCWPNLCMGQPNGALIANPQQCNAFFACENNEAVAKACFDGQWFDPSISACAADLKAVCYNPCANEKAGPVVLLPHPICNEYYFCNGKKTFVGTCQVGRFDIVTGVCNETEKCFPNPCDNSSIAAFPDPYDPTKFYWCNSALQPIPETCPSGMEFNVEFLVCKKVSDPDCPVCSKDGYFPTLYDKYDTDFCVCVDGLATKIECPKDYVFSSELGTCYSNAPCDPSFCLDAQEYDRAPNRNDSKSFCMCFNKKPTIINCPNNGTFNPYTLECSDYEISPECLQSTCVGEASNTYIFKPINTKLSNGFCQCVNQIATFRPCNYGSTLNPNLLICQLAEINCNSYQCRGLASKTVIPAVTTTEGYCECVGGVATFYNCPNNGEFNATTNKCEAPLCDLTKCTTPSTSSSSHPFPASTPNGFCMCSIGYVPCPTEATLFSEIYGNCIDPCPQTLCSGKPDKYLVSSLINKNSFCVCHASPRVGNSYELCPTESFIFDETEQRCIANSEEMCGSNLCKGPATFEAKNTLTGFCLCTGSGKKPTFEKCLEGIFVPDKNACLPTAEDVCDISLCSEATIDHPITLPANNSILEFCYCSSPRNAMLLPCPYGKYYNQAKAMCTSQIEDCSSCPQDVEEGQKVADTATCNKYSICIDGSMKSQTCPEGDYFNVELNDCIADSQGICNKKSDCTCLGIYYENELLPHPINPQMYYTCQSNTLHEYKCKMGYIFSAAQKQCIENHNFAQKRSTDFSIDHEFGCFVNEKRSVPSNCSQYEICLQNMWQLKTCPNFHYYNPEQRQCLEPRDDFVCSYAKVTTLPTCNASMEYYLLSGKRSCQQYYQCQAGKWRLKNCGRQQYFNKRKATCLPVPQDRLFTCDLLGNNTIGALAKEQETSTCQHLSQRFYGGNCAMYLICLDNDWWYQYCPPDMYYNRTLNYCVHDVQKQCMDVQRAALTSSTEEFSKNVCPQDGLLRPSAIACNRYFVCLKGIWQMQHCSLGEFYDVTNAKCSLDKENICRLLTKDCLPNKRRAMPRNCSSYEHCSKDGKWLKMACPQNEIFDERLQQCIINQGLCSKHGLKRSCRQHESIPLKGNCSMFYYCSEDNWSLGNCLRGFMYFNEKQMCIAHMPEDNCKPLNIKATEMKALNSSRENSACQGKIDGTAVAHSTDCRRYFVCIEQLISSEMQCPKGSYFDYSLGYCRPNDGSCRIPLTGACTNASDESLVRHPSNCQAFYKCSSINGTELLHCPEGQYFNNDSRQCRFDHGECKREIIVKPKCAGLEHGVRLAHETYCNIYYACVKSLAIPVQCPDNYLFNRISAKCVPDKEQQCQGGHLVDDNVTYSCDDSADGSYFPDGRDCTRYYICSQGQALPKKCAPSSFFDSELLLCVPDDGSCPYVNNDKEQHNLLPPEPSVCEGKHGYFIADPLNCNNFYACIHSKLKHERCYIEHFFNTTLQQCQQKRILETNIKDNTTSLTESRSANSRCLDEITSLKILCAEASVGTSMAEPGDCRRYITCQGPDEEPISQRCRNGESFDSVLGFCRQSDGTCLLENGQRVGECSGKHGQLARDPNNCRSFFICINGQKISQACKDGEYFSKTQNMCIKDIQKVCKTEQSSEVHAIMVQSCAGLTESVLYPYTHDNCRSYFQCINGVAKIHKCADDLYFDPIEIKCSKNISECIMPTQTQQRSPAFSGTFTKLCANKKLEYPYANVENECRSFYICHANGNVRHELCPLGMMFHKQLIKCTAENDADCILTEDITG